MYSWPDGDAHKAHALRPLARVLSLFILRFSLPAVLSLPRPYIFCGPGLECGPCGGGRSSEERGSLLVFLWCFFFLWWLLYLGDRRPLGPGGGSASPGRREEGPGELPPRQTSCRTSGALTLAGATGSPERQNARVTCVTCRSVKQAGYVHPRIARSWLTHCHGS